VEGERKTGGLGWTASKTLPAGGGKTEGKGRELEAFSIGKGSHGKTFALAGKGNVRTEQLTTLLT